MLRLLLLSWALARVHSSGTSVVVAVNDTAAVQTLDDLYQGYNIDSGSLYVKIQLSNSVLQQLVRNLAPAQLRIGGSASDSVWYVPNGTPGPGPSPDPLAPNYASTLSQPWFNASLSYTPEVTVVSDESWRAITGFAAATGTQLLWDVNAVDFRTPSGAWNPSANASALFAYTAANNLSVAAWELGNEPDIWVHHFNLSVSGTQLAADTRTMQSLLRANGLSTSVFGPSLATFNATLVQQYIAAWTATGGGPLGFTAHAYPLGPPTYPNGSANTPISVSGNPSCSVNNYFNRTRVNNLVWYLNNFTSVIAANGDLGTTRMVLEETASNSLGGCIGFSDRFISGFYWVNILGIVAEAGWQQINRQDLAGQSFTAAGSQYTLFGPPGWTNGSGLVPPHPDYFTSLLWRKLMGRIVMSNSLSGDTAALFTSHVWCSADTAPGAGPGAVTLAYTNAYNTSVSVTLASAASGVSYAASPRSEFFLTGESLTDKPMYLNLPPGASPIERRAYLLRVQQDGTLTPGLQSPVGNLVTDPHDPLVVPPQSYGFVVLHAAGVGLCASPTPTAAVPLSGAHGTVETRVDTVVVSLSICLVLAFALVARLSRPARSWNGSHTRVELARGLSKTGAGPSYGALL